MSTVAFWLSTPECSCAGWISLRDGSWAATVQGTPPHRRGGAARGLRHDHAERRVAARSAAHRPACAARRRHHVLPVAAGAARQLADGRARGCGVRGGHPGQPAVPALLEPRRRGRPLRRVRRADRRRGQGDPGCGPGVRRRPDPALRPRLRHRRALGGRAEAAAADAGRHHGFAVHRLRAAADAAAHPHPGGLGVPAARHVGARPHGGRPPQAARDRPGVRPSRAGRAHALAGERRHPAAGVVLHPDLDQPAGLHAPAGAHRLRHPRGVDGEPDHHDPRPRRRLARRRPQARGRMLRVHPAEGRTGPGRRGRGGDRQRRRRDLAGPADGRRGRPGREAPAGADHRGRRRSAGRLQPRDRRQGGPARRDDPVLRRLRRRGGTGQPAVPGDDQQRARDERARRHVVVRRGGRLGLDDVRTRLGCGGAVAVVPRGLRVRDGRRRHPARARRGQRAHRRDRLERHPVRAEGRGWRWREQARAPSAVPGVVGADALDPRRQRAGRHHAGVAGRHRRVAADRRRHERVVAPHRGGDGAGRGRGTGCGPPAARARERLALHRGRPAGRVLRRRAGRERPRRGRLLHRRPRLRHRQRRRRAQLGHAARHAAAPA